MTEIRNDHFSLITPGASFAPLSVRQRSAILRHVETHFGGPCYVLPAPPGDGPALEIIHIPPGIGRGHHTLITLGMSATEMAVPEGLESMTMAELVIALPAETQIPQSAEEQASFWPFRLLADIARQPALAGGWLVAGQCAATSLAIDDDQLDESFITAELRWPRLPEPDCCRLWVTADLAINFYGLTPLFLEEQAFKAQYGATALDELLLSANVTELVDLSRPNAAKGMPIAGGDGTKQGMGGKACYATALKQHLTGLLGTPDEEIMLETDAGWPLELLWFAATAERPWQVGITCGMANAGLAPLKDQPDLPRRAELVIAIPADAGSPLSDDPDSAWYLLREMAELTLDGLTGWGHGAIVGLEGAAPHWAGGMINRCNLLGDRIHEMPIAATGETLHLYALSALTPAELELARQPDGGTKLREQARLQGLGELTNPARAPLLA